MCTKKTDRGDYVIWNAFSIITFPTQSEGELSEVKMAMSLFSYDLETCLTTMLVSINFDSGGNSRSLPALCFSLTVSEIVRGDGEWG